MPKPLDIFAFDMSEAQRSYANQLFPIIVIGSEGLFVVFLSELRFCQADTE